MKIGIVGTGLMGAPVVSRLMEKGFDVAAWNRAPEKMDKLSGQGVVICTQIDHLIERCDVLLLFLADAAAIQSVLFEVNEASLAGKVIIQMGTIAPQESVALCALAVVQGAQWLEAPVLGSIPEARDGRLLLMVGSEPEQFEQQEGLLEALGEAPLWVGPVGQGAALKLAMNQLIAGLTATFSLSLGMVQRSGVDVEKFMKLTRESALYAPTFDKKLGKMLDDNFANPNFPLKHLGKDVDLFIEAAVPLGLNTAMLEGISRQIQKGLQQGDAEQDYSAIFRAITSS